jgi:hypothetical protein
VGAAPELGEASGDLPVAREEDLGGFRGRSLSQGAVPWIAGEFGVSTGRFSQFVAQARVRADRVGRLSLAWAAR